MLAHDDLDDLPVGVHHAPARERAKIGDGLIDAVGNNPCPSPNTYMIFYLICQPYRNAGIHISRKINIANSAAVNTAFIIL